MTGGRPLQSHAAPALLSGARAFALLDRCLSLGLRLFPSRCCFNRRGERQADVIVGRGSCSAPVPTLRDGDACAIGTPRPGGSRAVVVLMVVVVAGSLLVRFFFF